MDRGTLIKHWQSFVSTWGFNAENNALLAVPRGVVWEAWDKMLVEPWQDLDADPRTAPSTKVRMVTYNSWFAVETPPQIEKKLKHDYPEGTHASMYKAHWWHSV